MSWIDVVKQKLKQGKSNLLAWQTVATEPEEREKYKREIVMPTLHKVKEKVTPLLTEFKEQEKLKARFPGEIGRALQRFPETKVELKTPVPEWTGDPMKDVFVGRERAGRGLIEFLSSVPGEMVRGYGKTMERLTTPERQQEAWESLKRVKDNPLTLQTLQEPAFEMALDIPDFLPGGFIFSSIIEKAGKEATEKIVKEGGELLAKKAGQKITKESAEKAAKEVVEKGTKEAGEKYAFNINLERLKTTEGGEKVIKESAIKLKPELTDIKGKPLTHKEVLEEAKKARVLQEVSTRQGQKEAEAALLKTRQKLTGLSNQIDEAGGKVSKKVWREYVENLKTVSSYATEKGRALEALKIGAEGQTIRDELIKEILKTGADIDDIVRAASGVDFDNAREVAEFYRKFVKPGLGEKLDYYRYINMLSSPKTQIVNILGNLFQAPLAVGEKLYSGAIDAVASTLTKRQRTHYVREVPQYIKGFVNAIPEAMAKFKQAFKGKAAVTRPDIRRMPVATKGIGYAYGMPLRFMEGADVFFQTLFKSAASESVAYRYARAGEEISEKALSELAEKDALYRIFRQPLGDKEQGALLREIDKATNAVYSLRKVRGVKWFVPFVQTPMAILKQGIEFSPLGMLTAIGAKDRMTQVAKSMLGSTVMAGAGFLSMQDRTTWAPPKGEKDKAFFYASGKKPYAIKIGKNWVQYNKLGPLAYPIAMAAALKEESKDRGFDKKTSEVVKDVLLEVARFFTDQSYLEGMSNLISVASGEEYALEQAMANVPRQLIPLASLQGWVARIIDDIYRHPKTVVDRIKAGLPFLSKQVEPHRTPTGEVSRRDYPLLEAVSPVGVGEIKPEFEKLETARKKAKGLRKAREDALDAIVIEGDDEKGRKIAEENGVNLSNTEVQRRAKAEVLRLIGEGKDQEAQEIALKFKVSVSNKEANDSKNLYREIHKALPKSTRDAFIDWYESGGESFEDQVKNLPGGNSLFP